MRNIKNINDYQKSPVDYLIDIGLVRSKSQSKVVLFLIGSAILFSMFFLFIPSKPEPKELTSKELSKMKSLRLEPTPDFRSDTKIR